MEEKARVRRAHLIERDAQLGQASVRAFVSEMERRRLWRGEWHSVFSLMRDGSELAAELSAAGQVTGAVPLMPSTPQGVTQLSIAEIATFRRLPAPANTSTSIRPEHSHFNEDSEVPLIASS